MSRSRLALVIAGFIVAVDQATKTIALNQIDAPFSVIDGLLGFRIALNPGASFSLFQNAGVIIGILAIGVSVWIFSMIRSSPKLPETIALSMILGGALGNLTDRAVRGDGFLNGAVVDFVDLWIIPTLNVADASISLGAAFLVILALMGQLTSLEQPAPKESSSAGVDTAGESA